MVLQKIGDGLEKEAKFMEEAKMEDLNYKYSWIVEQTSWILNFQSSYCWYYGKRSQVAKSVCAALELGPL